MGYTFQKEYELKQWTPLIHFQHDQSGATLRATEVKPKLDRFIKSRYDSETIKKWKIKEHDALDYKMSIAATGKKTVDLNLQPYRIYYGNMGRKNDSEKIKAVICKNVTLIITCLKHPDLMQAIDENIRNFFIVTNFGSMQGKGFGSFTVGGTVPSDADVSAALKGTYEAKSCYMFEHNGKPFVQIKTMYGIMKTGVNNGGYERSLLFKFMHEKYKMGNEKAWLKQQGMAPAIGDNQPANDDRSNTHVQYYVRALFGVGDHIDFKNSTARGNNFKTKVSISSDEIERLNSPIFFKIIGDKVYFIAQRIDDEIYGKTFTFNIKTDRRDTSFRPQKTKGTLKVPDKKQLRDSFIDDYMDYAFRELNGTRDEYGALGTFDETEDIWIEEV